MEIDLRHVTRVARPESDPASSVARVSFEDGPGEVVLVALQYPGIAGKVSLEGTGETKDVEIRVGPGFLRLFDNADRNTVCGIQTLARLPRDKAGIRRLAGLRHSEGEFLQQRKVGVHFAHYPHFVAILQVLTHARQVNAHLDAEPLQLFTWSYAREFEQLWRTEGARRQDHFFFNICLFLEHCFRRGCCLSGFGICPVEMRT